MSRISKYLSLWCLLSTTPWVNAETWVPISNGDITFFIPVNLPPKASADSYTIDEDTPTLLDVTANDSDDDEISLTTITITTPATNGSALVTDGQIRYTPNANHNGTDTFSYQITDTGGEESEVVTVSITINPINDAPVATPDHYTITEDSGATNLPVLVNDADIDGSISGIEIIETNAVSAFGSRTLAINDDLKSINYQPPVNVHGEDWFTYRIIDDAQATSSPVRVNISITPQNDAPVANSIVLTTNEDEHTLFSPSVYDADGDTLTFLVQNTSGQFVDTQQPVQTTNGTIQQSNGQLIYTPAFNFNGQEVFTYIASDGTAQSPVATITINVTPVNDAPTILQQVSALNTNEDQAKIVNILDAVSDPDGDKLTIESMSVNIGTIEKYNSSEFTYTPPQHYNSGLYDEPIRATIYITDGYDSVPLYWDITINAMYDHPSIYLWWRQLNNGSTLQFFTEITNEDKVEHWEPYLRIYNTTNGTEFIEERYFEFVDSFKGEREQIRPYNTFGIPFTEGTWEVEVVIKNRSENNRPDIYSERKSIVVGDTSSPPVNQPPTAVDDLPNEIGFAYAGYDKDIDALANDYDDDGLIQIELVDNLVLKDSSGNIIENRQGKPLVTINKANNDTRLVASTDVCFSGEVSALYMISDEDGETDSATVSFESFINNENAAAAPASLAVSNASIEWTSAEDEITFSWPPVYGSGTPQISDKNYKVMIVNSSGAGFIIPSVTADNYNPVSGLFEYSHQIEKPGQYYAYVATCEPGSFDCGCYGQEAKFSVYSKSVRNFRTLNDVIDINDTVVLRWEQDDNHEYTLRYKAPGQYWTEIPGIDGEYASELTTTGTHEFQIKVCNQELDPPCGGWSATLPITVLSKNASVENAPSPNNLTDYGNNNSGKIESAKVGLTAGQFRVDESGAATYHIPFTLPQGIAGVTPSLGLSYSSAAGNGPVGIGWNITGLSQIARCRRTIEQDGKAGQINFDDTDAYCLDGQRLVEVSSAGSSGAIKEFRTEIDSKTRITAWESATNPTYFKVEREDGSVTYYGGQNIQGPTANSIIATEQGTLSWMISSISDNIGHKKDGSATNDILFNYENFADNPESHHYEILPTSVSYSGNTVRFLWGDGDKPDEDDTDNKKRTDVNVSYSHGTAMHSTKLLHKVIVYNHSSTSAGNGFSGDKLRRYEITYDSAFKDIVARISNIVECGYPESGGSACLPATTFDWYEDDYEWQTLDQHRSAIESTYRRVSTQDDVIMTLPVDVEGDGFSDLILMTQSGNTNKVYLSENTGGVLSSPVHLFTFSYDASQWGPQVLLPVDIDADGKLELLHKSKAYNGNGIDWNYWQMAPSAFGKVLLDSVDESVKHVRLQDINADALPDLLYQRDDINYIKVNTGNGTFSTETSAGKFTTITRDIEGYVNAHPQNLINQCHIEKNLAFELLDNNQLGDFNGDGRADTLLKGTTVWYCNDGTEQIPLDISGNQIRSGTYYSSFLATATLHKNGEQYSYGDYRYLAKSFSGLAPTLPPAAINYQSISIADINQDGLSDVLYYSAKAETELYALFGGQFENGGQRLAFMGADFVSNQSMQFLDLDGNQKTDIVFFDARPGYKRWSTIFQGSNGNFSVMKTLFSPGQSYQPSDRTFLADFDGDGKPGLGYTKNSNNEVFYYKDAFEKPLPEHRLKTITNGFGVITEVEYKQLTDSTVYEKGSSEAPLVYGRGSPVFDLINPGFVVSKVTSDSDGYTLNDTSLMRVGTESAKLSVSYQYKGLRAQAGGRGMLGFKEIATTDEQRNIVTTTTYRQDFPFIGMPLITVQSRNGTEFSYAENQYKHHVIERNTDDAPSYFPYLHTSVEKQYGFNGANGTPEQIGSVKTINTYKLYADNHYNLTNVTVTHKNGDETIVKTVTTDNEYDGFESLTDWHLGRISKATVTHERGSETDVRVSQFEYYKDTSSLYGLLKKEIVAPAPPGAENDLQLNTLHCYSDLGNKTSSIAFSNHHPVEDCSYEPKGDINDINQVFRKQTTQWSDNDRYVLSTSNALFTTKIIAESDYNRFNQPSKVSNADGVATEIWYDVFGRPYASQKPTGERQLTERRFKGQASEISAPSVVTRYKYVEKVSVKDSNNRRGAPDKFSYFDKMGRQLATAVAGFEPGTFYVTRTSYDLYGQVLAQTQPYKWQSGAADAVHFNFTQYDWLGRPETATAASGAVTTYSYLDKGLKTQAEVSFNGGTQTKSVLKNILGETIKVIDDVGVANVTVGYTYHPSGALHQSGLSGTKVTTDFDDYGRKTKMNDPDKGIWEYSYNALGELVTQTKKAKANSGYSDVVTTFTRDAAGRTIKRVVGSETTLYQFDSNNSHRLQKECFASSQDSTSCDSTKPIKEIAYDDEGRAHQLTTTIGTESVITFTTFDEFGRVFQQFDDYAQFNGLRLHYNAQGYQYMQEEARYSGNCDAAAGGRLSGCANIVYSRIKATDAYGNATEVLQNNDIVSTAYSVSAKTGLIKTSKVTSDNATIQFNEYQYDSLGNMKGRDRHSLRGIGTDAATVSYQVKKDNSNDNSNDITKVALKHQTFGYDSLNRLTTVNDVNWLTYYDNGNIKSKLDVGYYCYDASRPHAVSGVNQSDCTGGSPTTPFTYDDWGNMTGSGDRSIVYTAFDKAHTITKNNVTTTFAYDTARNRYERTDSDTDTRTLYFGAQERIYEKDSNDAWILKNIRRNLPGAIQTIDASSGAESTHYQHKDNLGSINTVTNENGRIVQKLYFDPWGKKFLIPKSMWSISAQSMEARTLANILDITPRGFTGHEHVDQADIIHMNGRIYDPTLGRFLQADPHIQAPMNSQNYNRYSYVLNNPMSYTDPSGYFFDKLFKGIKKYWRVIVAAVATVITYGAASGWVATWGATWGTAATATSAATLTWAGGAAAGAMAGFVGGAVATGSLKGALRGAFSGAVFGAIGTSGWGDTAKIAGHALAGGVISDLQGGNFGHGFWTAGIMKGVGILNAPGAKATLTEIAGRAVIQAMVGGTLSRVTGGKFANGAATSAIQYVVNASHQEINEAWNKIKFRSVVDTNIKYTAKTIAGDVSTDGENVEYANSIKVNSKLVDVSLGMTTDSAGSKSLNVDLSKSVGKSGIAEGTGKLTLNTKGEASLAGEASLMNHTVSVDGTFSFDAMISNIAKWNATMENLLRESYRSP